MTCLTEEQLLLLIDGGIPPNQAEPLRAHLAECASCRSAKRELDLLAGDLKADVPLDTDAHVAGVMRRVAAMSESTPLEKTAFSGRALAMAGACAMAAAVFLFMGKARVEPGAPEFASRGGKGAPSLARDVGVSLFAGSSTPVRLAAGARVTSETAYTAAYLNLGMRPAYALVFAVDAARTVHWLYPAYTATTEDPASIPLAPATSERMLPTSVVLEGPALGVLRVVTVATETVRHVSDIERRPAAGLTHEALVEAFPGAAVTELALRVEADARP
jgi:hypothetical protein